MVHQQQRTLEARLRTMICDQPYSLRMSEVMEEIGSRSYLYQNYIVNTIFIQIKHSRKKTNQMVKDLNACRVWNQKYKKIKDANLKREYPCLSLEQIEFWIPLAEEYQIDPIARGLKKSRYCPTDETFLEVYRKVKGRARKLCYSVIREEDPESPDWYTFRQDHLRYYLSRFTPQNPLSLYYPPDHQGYANLPTPEHLHLILHGYSPDPQTLKLFKTNHHT